MRALALVALAMFLTACATPVNQALTQAIFAAESQGVKS